MSKLKACLRKHNVDPDLRAEITATYTSLTKAGMSQRAAAREAVLMVRKGLQEELTDAQRQVLEQTGELTPDQQMADALATEGMNPGTAEVEEQAVMEVPAKASKGVREKLNTAAQVLGALLQEMKIATALDVEDATLNYALLPREVRSDENMTKGAIQKLADAFRSGVTSRYNRLQMYSPFHPAPDKQYRVVDLNTVELSRFGAELRGEKYTKKDKQSMFDNITAALGWLYGAGFMPRSEVTDATVLYSGKLTDKPITWGDVKTAPLTKETAAQKWKARIDEAIAEEEAGNEGAVDEIAQQIENAIAEQQTPDPERKFNDAERAALLIARDYLDSQESTEAVAQRRASEETFAADVVGIQGESGVENQLSEARADVTEGETATPEESGYTAAGQARDDRMAQQWANTPNPQQTEIPQTPINEPVSFGGEWLAPVVETLRKVFDAVKLNNIPFVMVDGTGLDELSARFGSIPENAAAIDLLRMDDPAGRTLWLKSPSREGRAIPVIYVSAKTEQAARPTIILHEAGHVVMSHMLHDLRVRKDEAGKEMQDAWAEMRKELGEDPAIFVENFANAFTGWYFNPPEAQHHFVKDSQLAKGKTVPVLQRVFKKMVTKLRELYQAMRKEFGRAVPATFDRFMKAWLDYDPVIQLYPPAKPGPVEYADFTPFEGTRTAVMRAASNRHVQRSLQQLQRGWRGFKKEMWQPFYETALQSIDQYLRTHGLEWVADEFHRRAGRRAERSKITLDHEVAMNMARWLNKLLPLLQGAPTRTLFRTTEESAEWAQAREQLLNGDPRPNAKARQLRALLNDVRLWANRHGARIAFVDNYWPIVYSSTKIMGDPDAFRQAVRDGVAEHNRQVDANNLPQELKILDVEEYANALYSKLGEGQATFEIEHEGTEIIAPGMSHKKHRTMSPYVRESLTAFREDNLVETVTRYIDATVKRVAWQRRFGLNSVLQQLDEAFANGGSQEYTRLRDELQREYERDYGVNIFDPSAGLLVDLKKQVRRGQISQKTFERVTTKIIPALQGRLGADMNPTLKRMSSLMLVYQNLRVLSLGVLSQFVDLGLVFNRAKSLTVPVKEIRHLLSKAGREELFKQARDIGTIRDDVMQHYLADVGSILNTYTSFRKWNEMFFRYNGMHIMTNTLRALDVAIGKTLIKRWAQDGDVAELERVGLSAEMVRDWQLAGEPMTPGSGHERIYAALNQFVDEGVIRPGASTRPVWGNDQRFALLWHLKSFMWGFHESILRRVAAETRDAEGLRKALPFITLAAMTVPFAAMGMELRWLITDPKLRPETGEGEWYWEAAQRAGILGLFQMYVDIDDAEEFGRFSILAPLGPTLNQVEDIISNNLVGYQIDRALPLRPVFQGLGRLAE